MDRHGEDGDADQVVAFQQSRTGSGRRGRRGCSGGVGCRTWRPCSLMAARLRPAGSKPPSLRWRQRWPRLFHRWHQSLGGETSVAGHSGNWSCRREGKGIGGCMVESWGRGSAQSWGCLGGEVRLRRADLDADRQLPAPGHAGKVAHWAVARLGAVIEAVDHEVLGPQRVAALGGVGWVQPGVLAGPAGWPWPRPGQALPVEEWVAWSAGVS